MALPLAATPTILPNGIIGPRLAGIRTFYADQPLATALDPLLVTALPLPPRAPPRT